MGLLVRLGIPKLLTRPAHCVARRMASGSVRSRKCPFRVTRDTLTARRSLPVFPDKRTISVSVGMSHGCQSLPKWVVRVTSAYATMAAVLRIRARSGTRSDHIASIGALWQVDCWRLAPSAP